VEADLRDEEAAQRRACHRRDLERAGIPGDGIAHRAGRYQQRDDGRARRPAKDAQHSHAQQQREDQRQRGLAEVERVRVDMSLKHDGEAKQECIDVPERCEVGTALCRHET